jgi:hypothetical protein
MTPFAVFIHDPHVTTPYVGVARVHVEADEEWAARSCALAVYNKVATGSFTEVDIGFAAQLASDGTDAR